MKDSESKQIASFLAQVSFFAEVSPGSLKQLCNYLETITYRTGEVVFKKGDIGDAMYVILEGVFNVHKEQHIYDTLTKGDCFGEYALIDDQSRSATVTAVESGKVLKVARSHFIDLMQHNTGFAQGVLAVMIKRHRILDETQEHLATSKYDLEVASAKMKGLIQGAMDAIIMFDQHFKIVLTNPSANKLLENKDVLKRNVLYFLDEESAELIEAIVIESLKTDTIKNYLPDVIKVIGSDETLTLNEGTISKYGTDDAIFFTLILRNIEERISAENTIDILTKQAQYLKEEIQTLTREHHIIAAHQSMKNVLHLIDQVADTGATVLITGETGTGKELVARAIHNTSNRNEAAFIRINCGAIPANLIESELFGHKKGAFTGAYEDRKGRFHLADKGTIFLDEIGELPIDLQPKLLRVIQEGEFEAVGSAETVKVDVRIIAATHRDLLQLSSDGSFREDLYYRLNVFPIQVPPLRHRGEDIHLITEALLEEFCHRIGKPIIRLSATDKKQFSKYDWPGNVRELQNLIERAVIVSQNGKIDWLSILPTQSKKNNELQPHKTNTILTAEEIVNFERENILRALKETRWKISGANGAAALLRIPPTTLASKIKALGIERPV